MPMTPNGTATISRPASQPARRFTDKPHLDPAAVMNLPKDHPALTENRTLFPSTVVDVNEDFEGNLLVSGRNNRKLGDKIAKGRFKGYALYGLSLEERATCPDDCSARSYCYGNGMQLARRHRIKDLEYFFTLLDSELEELFETEAGVMIRLHVLGDFPSADYVYYWNGLLEKFPKLACYGYTHRRMTESGGDEIGDAIAGVKAENPDRFRIRWSREANAPDSAIIINTVPDGPRFKGAIVCPAQTDATACCASCGLCWERATAKETIAFIKHGRKLESLVAEAANGRQHEGLRTVTPISLRTAIDTTGYVSDPPALRLVDPKSLLIETTYQRDLSPKSINLIRKIVAGWDWSKFKAVDLDEPVLTPRGWRNHGALAIGDYVFGPDGRPTKIIAKTPVFEDAACFQVSFCDGYSVVVSGDHLWTIEVAHRPRANARRVIWEPTTVDTSGLSRTVSAAIKRHHTHRFPRIAVAEPIQMPTQHLSLDPYVLGAWLGDGGTKEARITSGREDVDQMTSILEAVGVAVRVHPQGNCFRISLGGANRGDRRSPIVRALRDIGVFSRKHIPEQYLFAAEHQRFALLQGLMDTDGTCAVNGRATFCSANRELAESVHLLCMTLGVRAHLAERTPNYKGAPRSFWQVQFFADRHMAPFRLARKAVRAGSMIEKSKYRRIIGVQAVASRPTSCIQVARPDGLYLVGRHLVTTHNCPIVAETPDGKLVIVDGQHTAIAAASHPAIRQIPVMVTRANLIERRAAAFVSHNRDRLVMTPAQIFYGDLAAGNKEAKGVMECVVKAGASVPRAPVGKADWMVGQVSSVGEIRDAFRQSGRDVLERMLRIAVASKVAPLSKTLLRALRLLLTDKAFEATKALPDGTIATAIVPIGDIATASEQRAAELGISRFSACAELIAENAR